MDSSFSNKMMQKLFYHVIPCSILVLLTYFLLIQFIVNIIPGFYFKFISLHLIVFYINYTFFIPLLLFKKKKLQYILVSVILFLVVFFFSDDLMNGAFNLQKEDQGKLLAAMTQDIPAMGNEIVYWSGLHPQIKMILLMNTFLIFYLGSLSVRLVQKWSTDENYKAKLEAEKKSTEISFLKHQINPHFIFNTLNSIYSLSISNSKAVSESIIRLSSILRYMLYESEDKIKSGDELRIIEDYIQLQKLRLTDKVTVNYRIINEPVEHRIEPLIIITLLENAFKYGANVNSSSFIDIFLVIINGRLILKVGNKIVRKMPYDEKSSGLGLKNIQRRLDLIYPDRYKYNVDIKDMVYNVYLEVEL